MTSFGINCNASLMMPFRREASETLCLQHMGGVAQIREREREREEAA